MAGKRNGKRMRHLLFLFLIVQMATAAGYEPIWSGVKPARILRLEKADGPLGIV
jgi:hypothetical protein